MWFFKTEVIDKLKTPIDANTPILTITNKVNRWENKVGKAKRKKIFDEKVKPNIKCN